MTVWNPLQDEALPAESVDLLDALARTLADSGAGSVTSSGLDGDGRPLVVHSVCLVGEVPVGLVADFTSDESRVLWAMGIG